MDFIARHLSACLEDGNLEINVDEKNALKSCFSEDDIRIFYILDGIETKVEIGSNIITNENIKEKKSLPFIIKKTDVQKEIEITLTSPKSNTLLFIGIGIGSGISVVLLAVICFPLSRWRSMTNGEVDCKEEETMELKRRDDFKSELDKTVKLHLQRGRSSASGDGQNPTCMKR